MRFWFTIALLNVSATCFAGAVWLLVTTMTDGRVKPHELALGAAVLLLACVNVAAAHWLAPCAEREQKTEPKKCPHLYFATSARLWRNALSASHDTEISRFCVLCWAPDATRWRGAWSLNALNHGYDTPQGLRDAYLTQLAREKASGTSERSPNA
jgi:hypothetical protein